ncbi:hypothetical protein AAHA92_12857 [Salvia divinorum]|uniref:Trichome birefringence-like N-terminal domain-containing protein n=1 Tax=Salvia divinorum TaxID=28513 RepID=A0ABD1H6F4_SALDI
MGFWWSSPHKTIHYLIKLSISALLVGLAFRLIHNRSSAVSGSLFLENTISADSQENTDHLPTKGSEEKCNLFHGVWVANKAGPFYTNGSCNIITEDQNCMKNGRPDSDYLYWKWKPRGCELARLDPGRFLDLMRNKTWAFVGDSISRNQFQSLLCILSKVEEAVLVHHDENYKFQRWFLPLHNLTFSLIWSPFLAQAAVSKDNNGVSTSGVHELHLDSLDKSWTEQYNSFDYMILSSGKWFLNRAVYYTNNTVLGCHHCLNKNFTELGFDFAYRRVIRAVLDYILTSSHKGMIFYRTSTPDHFEGGQWFEGGTCSREAPVQEGQFELSEVNKILRDIELEEFGKIIDKAYENGVDLRLFDVNPMSLLRPDGHPGPYRFYQPFAKDGKAKVISDCLHWCLPGPIDSWNDVLMEMIING